MDKTITAIDPQKKNQNRLNVYIENEFAFGVSRFVGRTLKIGQTLTSVQIQELKNADDREKAYQKALQYISYKPRTESEVVNKLKVSDFGQLIVHSVIAELQEKNYLNDVEYAADWVQIRSASKPRSKKQLFYELKKKGISEEGIQEAIKNAPDDFESALKLSSKYLNRYQHLSEIEFRKKMLGVLARRAYPYEIINRVIDKNLSEKIKNKLNVE